MWARLGFDLSRPSRLVARSGHPMRGVPFECAIRLTHRASLDCHQQLNRVRGRTRGTGAHRAKAHDDHVRRRRRIQPSHGWRRSRDLRPGLIPRPRGPAAGRARAAHHSGPERLARPYPAVDFHLPSFAGLSWRSPVTAEGVEKVRSEPSPGVRF